MQNIFKNYRSSIKLPRQKKMSFLNKKSGKILKSLKNLLKEITIVLLCTHLIENYVNLMSIK